MGAYPIFILLCALAFVINGEPIETLTLDGDSYNDGKLRGIKERLASLVQAVVLGTPDEVTTPLAQGSMDLTKALVQADSMPSEQTPAPPLRENTSEEFYDLDDKPSLLGQSSERAMTLLKTQVANETPPMDTSVNRGDITSIAGSILGNWLLALTGASTSQRDGSLPIQSLADLLDSMPQWQRLLMQTLSENGVPLEEGLLPIVRRVETFVRELQNRFPPEVRSRVLKLLPERVVLLEGMSIPTLGMLSPEQFQRARRGAKPETPPIASNVGESEPQVVNGTITKQVAGDDIGGGGVQSGAPGDAEASAMKSGNDTRPAAQQPESLDSHVLELMQLEADPDFSRRPEFKTWWEDRNRPAAEIIVTPSAITVPVPSSPSHHGLLGGLFQHSEPQTPSWVIGTPLGNPYLSDPRLWWPPASPPVYPWEPQTSTRPPPESSTQSASTAQRDETIIRDLGVLLARILNLMVNQSEDGDSVGRPVTEALSSVNSAETLLQLLTLQALIQEVIRHGSAGEMIAMQHLFPEQASVTDTEENQRPLSGIPILGPLVSALSPSPSRDADDQRRESPTGERVGSRLTAATTPLIGGLLDNADIDAGDINLSAKGAFKTISTLLASPLPPWWAQMMTDADQHRKAVLADWNQFGYYPMAIGSILGIRPPVPVPTPWRLLSANKEETPASTSAKTSAPTRQLQQAWSWPLMSRVSRVVSPLLDPRANVFGPGSSNLISRFLDNDYQASEHIRSREGDNESNEPNEMEISRNPLLLGIPLPNIGYNQLERRFQSLGNATQSLVGSVQSSLARAIAPAEDSRTAIISQRDMALAQRLDRRNATLAPAREAVSRLGDFITERKEGLDQYLNSTVLRAINDTATRIGRVENQIANRIGQRSILSACILNPACCDHPETCV
eukprot:Gregarina_sp_Poly_1__10604@NODE_791_length_6269_cov_18_831990_g579_i0_p1_GENE_NODE_791_length_6269_cov_18_831990_g579_i0NODE_791_length_6269_cov_18_831990_g579_i0_p1_ORF_typecomplete_len905_score136_55Apolipoprotein/PF01442_18/0_12STAT_alpha/PF01017_20/0_4STAT_alpha/PF01017_20/3e03_NODE_791_length_6269_cov_18_831990_g579_i0142728